MKKRLIFALAGAATAIVFLTTSRQTTARFSQEQSRKVLENEAAKSTVKEGVSQDIRDLVLEVQADHQSYLPGEVVSLSIKVKNNSGRPVLIDGRSNVYNGLLKVFISDDTVNYREYLGPRWGLKDSFGVGKIELAPGHVFDIAATVLYNQTVNTSHLSAVSAAQVAGNRLTNEYALNKPGMYYLKAILYNVGYVNMIESEPTQIIINEPLGDDLKVWNHLKQNGQYGLLIQTGDVEASKAKEIVRTLETLMEIYPASKYTKGIRLGISKRVAIEDAIKQQFQRPTNN